MGPGCLKVRSTRFGHRVDLRQAEHVAGVFEGEASGAEGRMADVHGFRGQVSGQWESMAE